MSKLFSEFNIKDMKLKNRIVMAPMCMDSANGDGTIKDWHYVHYITRAVGGVGLVILEATAVEERGRTLDKDLGIWEDYHIEGLKKIVEEGKRYGVKIGIQLSHGGRKSLLHEEDIMAPSAIPFIEGSRVPREMTKEDIRKVIEAFKQGAFRANKVGFDIIEIHGAHGYLINQFLSPLTNVRNDEYGGSLINRARFLKEIIRAIREVWPKEKPLFLRVSAEDYDAKGNHPEDLAHIINLIKEEDVDVIDVSSGGILSKQVKAYPGYQIKYAEEIKAKTSLPVIAGGFVTDPTMAEEILQNNRADLIFLGRELLRNPYWPMEAAKKLGDEIDWPEQYLTARI